MVKLIVKMSEVALARLYKRSLHTFSDLTREMDRIGQFAIEDARDRLAKRKSETSGGRLAKSLKHRAYKTSVVIASALRYALMQQRGGTIVPRIRKWLAIPLKLADKRIGLWPKHVSGKPGVHLRFVERGPGKALLFYSRSVVQGKKHKTVESYPRWLLLKRVQIPANPYLVKSPRLLKFMKQVIGDRLRRRNRSAG